VLLEGLGRIAGGALSERVAAEVKKYVRGKSVADIAEALNCAPNEVLEAIRGCAAGEIAVYGGAEGYLIAAGHRTQMVDAILKILALHHEKNPLDKNGKTREELLGAVGAAAGDGGDGFMTLLLQELVRNGKLAKVNHTYALAGRSVVLSGEERERAAVVEALVKEYGMQAPIMAELEKKAGQRRIDPKALRAILKYLTEAKVLYGMEGTFLHQGIVDGCRGKLLHALAGKAEGLTVAAFRDLVQGNRKLCLLLLAIYEREGVVERVGDVRVITEKGMNILKGQK
jgi:hypothetical protein